MLDNINIHMNRYFIVIKLRGDQNWVKLGKPSQQGWRGLKFYPVFAILRLGKGFYKEKGGSGEVGMISQVLPSFELMLQIIQRI